MKKILLVLMLPLALSINAQNKLIQTDTDSLLGNLDLNHFVPAELNNIFNPNGFLRMHFKGFCKNHLYFDGVSFAYSLFVYGGGELLYERFYDFFNKRENENFELSDYDEDFKRLRKIFFSNKAFYEPMYNAVIPYYKNAFEQMSPAEQKAFMSLLDEGIQYTDTFDLKKEIAFQEENDLVYYKGKMSAFIFRRIANFELSKEECLYWLKKIKSDLKSVEKALSNNDDNYTIMGSITENVFWAKVFNGEVNQQKLFIIENGQLQSLSGEVEIGMYNFDSNNTKHPYCQLLYSNGKNEILIFNTTNLIKREQIIRIKTDKKLHDIICLTNCDVLIYKDGSSEILYGVENGFSKIQSIKSENALGLSTADYINNFVYLNYENGSSELIYVTENPSDLKRIKAELGIESLVVLSENKLFQLEFSNGKIALIFIENNNQFKTVFLPEKYHFVNFEYWKNKLIFSAENLADELDFYNDSGDYWYGAMDTNGKILIEPIYSEKLILNNANFLLLGQVKNNKLVYAIFDSSLNKITEPEYYLNYKVIMDPEFGEMYFEYEDSLNAQDQSLILVKHLPNKEKVKYLKTVINKDGKIIIPAKWSGIFRLNLGQLNYFSVCNKSVPADFDMDHIGKFAIFDVEGNQLTKFKYDAIYSRGDYFEAIIGNKKVKIDKKGKEIK
jgi:hypothetical protein